MEALDRTTWLQCPAAFDNNYSRPRITLAIAGDCYVLVVLLQSPAFRFSDSGRGIVSVIMLMRMVTFSFLPRIPMDSLMDFDPAIFEICV